MEQRAVSSESMEEFLPTHPANVKPCYSALQEISDLQLN